MYTYICVYVYRIVAEFSKRDFAVDSDLFDEDDMKKLGRALSILWGLSAIQATFSKRGNTFWMDSNMAYWFDKAEQMMEADYTPSNEEIIRSRVRTTGVVEFGWKHVHEYSDDEVNKEHFEFCLVDTGSTAYIA